PGQSRDAAVTGARAPEVAGEGRTPARRRDPQDTPRADGERLRQGRHPARDVREERGLMRIVMMGTGTFAEPTFQALLSGPHEVVGLVTQPDRDAGSERGSTRQTGQGMKNIALAHNVPVFQPESVNTPEGVAGVQGFKPDLLVVAAY